MQVSRRQFFKICAGGMAGRHHGSGTGFLHPASALAETRQYKLLRTRETRNTCTYCSVGCGLLMYSLGDGSKKRQSVDLTISKGTRITRSAAGHFVRKAQAYWISSTPKTV